MNMNTSKMTTHFNSDDYLVIKTPRGQYSFRYAADEDLRERRDELIVKRERIQREIDALESFLNGETLSDPDALRVW